MFLREEGVGGSNPLTPTNSADSASSLEPEGTQIKTAISIYLNVMLALSHGRRLTELV